MAHEGNCYCPNCDRTFDYSVFVTLDKVEKELDQLRTQLAGCSVAALGATSSEQVATKGMFGWSVAYQDVLDLRLKYEKLTKDYEALQNRIEFAASGK